MNCTNVNAIMDQHRDTRLTGAERNAVGAHVLDCTDCAAARVAYAELLAITVPAMSPDLLDSILETVSLGARPAYAARRGVIVATVLLTGAALAAIGVMQLHDPARDDSAPQTILPRSQSLVTSAPGPVTANPTSLAGGTANLPVDTTAIELYIAPVVRTAPEYPPTAVERGLEGSVTLQYDVTVTGVVENVSVVQSTDAVFEAPAANALAQWKYLPRIAAGKRVASLAQQTVIRFQLDRTAVSAPRQREIAAQQVNVRGLSTALQVAWERVAADDLRGAELQLDEARALYELDGFQEGIMWDFYAYLYTVQGNYDRAIESYETGIAAYARANRPSQGSWLPLANLYYARHQYDLALRMLLTYKGRIKGTPAERVSTPLADEFIARLAALGVTDATLPPRR
ncbi:MAG: energy transducer TonB [Gammaproteobacteria bacterium]